MHGCTRLPVRELNPHLMCVLCGGYLIDATVSTECLHAFCKTCIIKYTEGCKTCPICDTLIHKTRPTENLRLDKTLQDLVYKLIPGLFQGEMKRRRDYYSSNTTPENFENMVNPAEARGEVKGQGSCAVPVDDEHISVCLQMANRLPPYKNDSTFSSSGAERMKTDCRYLLCPSAVTVSVIQKFIRQKFDISQDMQVDVFHSDESLPEQYTLQDIYALYGWLRRKPLRLYYLVYNPRELSLSAPYKVPEVLTRPSLQFPQQSTPCQQTKSSTASISPSMEPESSQTQKKITLKVKLPKDKIKKPVSCKTVCKSKAGSKKPITLTIKTTGHSERSSGQVFSCVGDKTEETSSQSGGVARTEVVGANQSEGRGHQSDGESEHSRCSTPLSRVESYTSTSAGSSSPGSDCLEDLEGYSSSSDFCDNSPEKQKLSVTSIDNSDNGGIRIRIRRSSGKDSVSPPSQNLLSADTSKETRVSDKELDLKTESETSKEKHHSHMENEEKSEESEKTSDIFTESECKLRCDANSDSEDEASAERTEADTALSHDNDVADNIAITDKKAHVTDEDISVTPEDNVMDTSETDKIVTDKDSCVNDMDIDAIDKDSSVTDKTPVACDKEESKPIKIKKSNSQGTAMSKPTVPLSPKSLSKTPPATCIILVPSSSLTTVSSGQTRVPAAVLKAASSKASKSPVRSSTSKTAEKAKKLWSPAKEISLPVLNVPSPYKVMSSLPRIISNTCAHGSTGTVKSPGDSNKHAASTAAGKPVPKTTVYSKIAPKPEPTSPQTSQSPSRTGAGKALLSKTKGHKRPLVPRCNSKPTPSSSATSSLTDTGPPNKVPKIAEPVPGVPMKTVVSSDTMVHYRESIHAAIPLAPPVIAQPSPQHQARNVFSPSFHYPHSPIFGQYQYSPYHHHNSPPQQIPLVYTALSPELHSPTSVAIATEAPLELTTQSVKERHRIHEPQSLSSSSRRMS